MRITKVKTYKVVNDDGSPLHPITETKVRDLYRRFKTNHILGRWSPVSDAAALRMVVTVMDAYTIKRKEDDSVGDVNKEIKSGFDNIRRFDGE